MSAVFPFVGCMAAMTAMDCDDSPLVEAFVVSPVAMFLQAVAVRSMLLHPHWPPLAIGAMLSRLCYSMLMSIFLGVMLDGLLGDVPAPVKVVHAVLLYRITAVTVAAAFMSIVFALYLRDCRRPPPRTPRSRTVPA